MEKTTREQHSLERQPSSSSLATLREKSRKRKELLALSLGASSVDDLASVLGKKLKLIRNLKLEMRISELKF